MPNQLNSILFFVCLLVVVSAPSVARTEAIQCLELLGVVPQPLSEITSEKYGPKTTAAQLKGGLTTHKQTVFVIRRTKTHIILRKANELSWVSRKTHVDGAETPHGDPRALVLIAGTKIGRFLGFRLVEGDGYVELHVPQVHYFKSKLAVLNGKLVKAELDPIIFNLKKTGLASDREIVGLSRHKKGVSEFHFPFDDADPMLLIHEYSYHLAALLMPSPSLRRASLVSDRLIEFAKSLEKIPGLHQVARAIISERTEQLDAATGGIAFTLWGLKYSFPNMSFREIANKLSENPHSKELTEIKNMLAYLTQSSTTPSRAAIFSAIIFAGINKIRLTFDENERFRLANELSVFKDDFGVRLTPAQKESLKQAMYVFYEKYAAEHDGFDPVQSDQNLADPVKFLKAIDQTIQDIEKVI